MGLLGRPRRTFSFIALLALSLFAAAYWTGYTDDYVPSVSRFGFSTTSLQSHQVPEIYGALNLVSPASWSPHQRLLPSQHAQVLVNGPSFKLAPNIAQGVYDLPSDPVNFDWKRRREEIDHKYPIIVFGKSYCPYTKRLLALLGSLPIHPEPLIVQIDERDDMALMQDLLLRLTGRRTVPNVLVHGKSIGGSDDLHALANKDGKVYKADQGGALREIFQGVGVLWGTGAEQVEPVPDAMLEDKKRWAVKQDS